MRKFSWSLFLLLAGLAFLAPKALAMKLDDVLALLKSGVGEQVILDQVNAEGIDFRLSTGDILALKSAGATDSLIREMIRQGSDQNAQQPAADSTSSTEANLHIYYDPFDYYGAYWPSGVGYYDPWIWRSWNFGYAGWWGHTWSRPRPGYHVWHGHPGNRGDRGGRTVWNRPQSPRQSWDRGGAPGRPGRDVQRPQQQAPSRTTTPSTSGERTRSAPSQPARPANPGPGRSAWRR